MHKKRNKATTALRQRQDGKMLLNAQARVLCWLTAGCGMKGCGGHLYSTDRHIIVLPHDALGFHASGGGVRCCVRS